MQQFPQKPEGLGKKQTKRIERIKMEIILTVVRRLPTDEAMEDGDKAYYTPTG